MKKVIGLLFAAMMIAAMMAFTLMACTGTGDSEVSDVITELSGTEAPTATPEAEVGTEIEAEGGMFTVTEDEARAMALAAVPGEIFNVTTSSKIINDDLELYTWHVIIDTPEDGRVVVEIVKASGELNVLPMRR